MAQTTSKKTRQKRPTAPGAGGGSSRGFLLAVIGIVVVGLGAVAVFATNRGEGDASLSDAEQTAPVELDGAALPQLPEGVRIGDATSDPAFGTTAPTLTGTGFDGTDVVIGADGSPKVVYFLAHWCPHCQAEVPLIQDLIEDGRLPDGLDVYAVSTAVDRGRGNFPPSDWLGDEGFTPTVVRDDADGTAFATFGGSSFPYVVYLDGDNRVLGRSAGSLDGETIEQLWELTASG